MWKEIIWIVVGVVIFYYLILYFSKFLKNGRTIGESVEGKSTSFKTKDFWDEEIERKSQTNPAYRDSSWKKEGDRKREEYVKKNPPVKKVYPSQQKYSGKPNKRINSKARDSENTTVAVFNPVLDDDVKSEDSNTSSHSSHSVTGLGAGGAFGGGGASGHWSDSHSSSSSSSHSHSDYSSHDSSSSSDSGGDCGGD